MNVAGITILSTENIIGYNNFALIIGGICLICLCAIIVLNVVSANISSKYGKYMNNIAFAIFIALFLIGLKLPCFTEVTGVKYKCLINDEVSFTYVHENYDVVDKDGAIWILEQKDEDRENVE